MFAVQPLNAVACWPSSSSLLYFHLSQTCFISQSHLRCSKGQQFTSEAHQRANVYLLTMTEVQREMSLRVKNGTHRGRPLVLVNTLRWLWLQSSRKCVHMNLLTEHYDREPDKICMPAPS